LATMFQHMGYKGWVVLFDEAEAVVQSPINARRKNYMVLDRFLRPEKPMGGLYPVFALTDDFFTVVRNEDYDRVVIRNDRERPYFPKNYDQAWRHLNIHDLHGLSPAQWRTLAEKLILFHAKAYGWQPPDHQLIDQLTEVLNETAAQEPRLKIKALVNQLDLAQQEIVLN